MTRFLNRMLAATCLLTAAAQTCITSGAFSQSIPPKSFLVCGDSKVLLVDYTQSKDSIPQITWSWDAHEAADLPGHFRTKLFNTMDDCKAVRGGKQLLVSSSSGAVALLNIKDKKVLFHASVPNAHSIEVLPGDLVAAAASVSPTGNKLMLFSLKQPDKPLYTDSLYSAHGVVWNEKRQSLFALGYDVLREYKLVSGNSLKMVAKWTIPGIGGHELQPANASGDLFVTEHHGTWLFSLTTQQFTKIEGFPDAENVKSLGRDASGQYIYTIPEESWWTFHVKFHGPARKFAFPDMHVYKARWFDTGNSIDNPLSRAHSHNDYMQAAPFTLAYQHQFGSVEADVHLRNDTLFVAHDSKDISADRTFDKLYLQQIVRQVTKNQGSIYQDKSRVMTLLVDLKTPYKTTLPALVKALAKYEELLAPKGSVKVVVSGNTPAPELFEQYPAYVFFDGRPGTSYTAVQVARLGMISQDFHKYSQWNGKGIPVEQDRKAITDVISQAHAMGKPFRFWASPDNINAWKVLMNLGVDYVNTDHVAELGTFLSGRKNAEYKSAEFYKPYQPTYKNNDGLGKVKNIILLIGDGMGLAQIYSGLTANRGELNLGKFLNIGFSKTASSDNYITDSAAGATALATGNKTRNRAIGVDSNLVAVPSIIRQVKATGRKSALISAGDITDATPAAFYAHRPERSMMEEIATDFLKEPVDVLIGGGYSHFAKTKTADSLKARGFQVSDSWNDLGNMKAPFVLLDDKHTVSMLNGRGDFLKESFQKTLQSLQSNPKGFFMMAEGAQVDYGGHANIVPYVVTEMLDFDKLVGEALRFADSNGETLVIVTADHETGGLTLLDGNLKTGYVDGQFSTGDHTGIMVPVFAYGPHSLDFRGVYENTEIYQKMRKVLK